ncbi:hypothetical protein P4O66_002715 [Electrophorus voltai]|uniref:Uncharacterized protein n=1 Tax=Electrophorus voltai TaxID=2609070 RepID=A0AAD9DMM6_9TELE|nr:hypothetical protein P4O66_002715 [Electrophorus voltai]
MCVCASVCRGAWVYVYVCRGVCMCVCDVVVCVVNVFICVVCVYMLYVFICVLYVFICVCVVCVYMCCMCLYVYVLYVFICVCQCARASKTTARTSTPTSTSTTQTPTVLRAGEERLVSRESDAGLRGTAIPSDGCGNTRLITGLPQDYPEEPSAQFCSAANQKNGGTRRAVREVA